MSVTLEIRCPERHKLAEAELPRELLGDTEPRIYFAVRCVRCRVDVEAAFVPATEGEDPKRWKRQQRSEYQCRCPGGKHLLGRVSIPVKYLKADGPTILFRSVCRACNIPVEATFTGAQESNGLAPAASNTANPALPGEVQAVCDPTG